MSDGKGGHTPGSVLGMTTSSARTTPLGGIARSRMETEVMPKQKDLKRLVRVRMQKTGEAYTAARLQVLQKPEPDGDLAKRAGMSDASIAKATGRGWSEWVKRLDRAGAVSKPHREIVALVSSVGVPRLVGAGSRRWLRAHPGPARPRPAPRRRIRSKQEPHISSSGRGAL